MEILRKGIYIHTYIPYTSTLCFLPHAHAYGRRCFSKRKCIRLEQWNSNCPPKLEPNSFNMADDESSSTSDESLDVKSAKFDPMKALYSRKIDLSVTRAPIYDNVSKFEAVMSGLSGQMKVRIAFARADSPHTHTHSHTHTHRQLFTHFRFHFL